jgi:hypothetical protein
VKKLIAFILMIGMGAGITLGPVGCGGGDKDKKADTKKDDKKDEKKDEKKADEKKA